MLFSALSQTARELLGHAATRLGSASSIGRVESLNCNNESDQVSDLPLSEETELPSESGDTNKNDSCRSH